MYLFLVKRTEIADYDEYDGVILRAKTKERAFELATRPCDVCPCKCPCGAAYIGFRLDGSNLSIACIGKANPYMKSPEGEVLSSFNAG